MAGLTIGWEYLTGNCVATDPAGRERAEWPPHPGRVFMALAAAWFETGEDADEGKALYWLEALGNPQMFLPPRANVFPRRVVEMYVPVNDVAGPSKAIVQSAPTITRDRKDRTFPTMVVGEAPCFLHWPSAAEAATHRLALGRLCGKVTRIGHSSSFVRMWLDDEIPPTSEAWLPDEALADFRVRRVTGGTLKLLEHQYNRRGREQHEQLSNEIAELDAARRTKGRGARERKSEIEHQISSLKDQLASINNRDPIRPKLGLWSGYRRLDARPATIAKFTHFDSDLLILTQVGGLRLPAEVTLAVTQALRGAVMKHSAIQPPPPWVSGHLETGQPLRDGRQHLAVLPLPFVGSDYADGHLLGLALAFPSWVTRQERGQVLGPMLLSSTGESKSVELRLGSLGECKLAKREWSESRWALKPEGWSEHPRGWRTWASVTPVVLDGFPKEVRDRDWSAWTHEVIEMIVRACERVGLPVPTAVDFDTTSWHRGSPRAFQKRRPLRGHSERINSSASLGNGFPMYPEKKNTGIRPQFHVWLQFGEPVIGPVLLGAGRFLGYGLCKPLRARVAGGHVR